MSNIYLFFLKPNTKTIATLFNDWDDKQTNLNGDLPARASVSVSSPSSLSSSSSAFTANDELDDEEENDEYEENGSGIDDVKSKEPRGSETNERKLQQLSSLSLQNNNNNSKQKQRKITSNSASTWSKSNSLVNELEEKGNAIKIEAHYFGRVIENEKSVVLHPKLRVLNGEVCDLELAPLNSSELSSSTLPFDVTWIDRVRGEAILEVRQDEQMNCEHKANFTFKMTAIGCNGLKSNE